MHPLLPSLHESLGLPFPKTPDANEVLIKTVIAELLPDAPPSATLSENLKTLGYVGSHSPHQISSFLLTSLQTHRILQHAPKPTPYSADDLALTDAVSRLAVALNLVPDHTDSFSTDHLLDLLRQIREKLAANPELLGEPMPVPALSSLSPPQRAECEAILTELEREHAPRVAMQLTRVQVTLDAFRRSPRVADGEGRLVLRESEMRVERLRREFTSPSGITLYDACAAREPLLDVSTVSAAEAAHGDDVKGFVMGAVPDRGGRLGEGAGMPGFRGRVQTHVERSGRRGRPPKKKKKNRG